MRVNLCARKPLLQPCSLEGHAYQLDPYIGCEHHCYYCYALNGAETDWSEEILTYRDIAGQLDRELRRLRPQSIYLGWNSDPYQPSEEVHRQTRRALKLLARRGFSVCILTKSGLVARDADLLAKMPGSSAGISIAFQDDRVRRLFEASAPANARRIEALRALKGAGVKTYALICPVMPFITDVKSLVEMVAPYADTIWIYALSFETEGGRNWQNVHAILGRHFPSMAEQYGQIAFSAGHPYWAELQQELAEFQRESQLDVRTEL